ncbi:MAG: UDP-N-acetylmuramoylalanine--D-glutamate ligase [Candidatus Parcubacteria bacterium]|nr:MAG: UDP-N-acetylmuramoylalanine--D-glutamate ligase [Candidatus Parcubacteria bacterium]
MVLKNKNVLIFGLGILGGGLANVEFFIKNKSKIRITDLKKIDELKNQIKIINRLKEKYKYPHKIKYTLGSHNYEDFDWAEIIVVNPAISYKNNFIKCAKKKNKIIINDCYLFFKLVNTDIIAITGTRGKTTTSFLTYQLFKKFFDKNIVLGGNQPTRGLLKLIDEPSNLFVLEISSFQLEFYKKKLKAPKISIITNLYEDHLDRYATMEEYASIKAKIFLNQTKKDFLILNYDNDWTKFFLKFKPQSQTFYVSQKIIGNNLNGIFYQKDKIIIKHKSQLIKLTPNKKLKYLGVHNLYNLLNSILALYLYSYEKNIKINWSLLEKYLNKLNLPEFRQQIIYQGNNLSIINDSASTTPQATIEAIKRFHQANHNLILIVGGKDKNLNFQELAKSIKQKVEPQNLIILSGTASQKIIKELNKINYNLDKYNIFDDLRDCLNKALELTKENKKHNIILFSPAGSSFEKFKNEFDRGKKFNLLVKRLIKNEKNTNRN